MERRGDTMETPLNTVEKLWASNLRQVTPYTPGEQPEDPEMIKLNTNENPYPPAPGVQALMARMQTEADTMRLYPNPASKSLVQSLAAYYGLSEDEVFVGVGSDDVLSVAFLTFFNSGKPILFPSVTYSFYPVWADVYRIPFVRKALDADFHIRPEDYMEACGGIVLANPNAPTGVCEDLSVIEDIVRAHPEVIVVVDEAYVDFGGASALPLTRKYDNLLVVQTFSKSRSMAGMRIGFAMGNAALIKAMNDVKYAINSYTMNRPSLILGPAAVEDDAYFKATTAKIIATRERAKERLAGLGFSFPDSKTNFIYAKHASVPGKELFDALREAHIYVRRFDTPGLKDYLRITIGTDAQMDRFFEFLEGYLAAR